MTTLRAPRIAAAIAALCLAACASTVPSLPRRPPGVTGLETFAVASEVPMHINYWDSARASIEEVVVNPSQGKVRLALPKGSTILLIFFYVDRSVSWSDHRTLFQTLYQGPISKGSTIIDGRHYYER